MDQYKRIYFVGIGGIGMSALARWFNANGFQVGGYDKTRTKLIEALEKEGIVITLMDSVDTIPEDVKLSVVDTLIVYTPAVPVRHIQMNYFKDNNFMILKRSQVLGMLTNNMRTIGVAGTHGKTTTSSMVAHILKVAGVNSTAFLGGITQNYGTNLLLNSPTENLEEVVCVVEADEFDRSFLTLFPEIGIVTSTDADHLDIYGKHDAVLDSFREYVSQIDEKGILFLQDGLEIESACKAKVVRYSLDSGTYKADNIHTENARFVFDLIHPEGTIKDIRMVIPGYHNIENAIASAGVAMYLGVDTQLIKEALESYKGVKRRFEYHIENESVVYIDDYAHHPTEIDAFLKSVRHLYPGKKITVVFQPHLFTRTRDFLDDFAKSLSNADCLLLLDIYPAREEPIAGINSGLLLEKTTTLSKFLVSKSELIDKLDEIDLEVLVTIGAGDIDTLIEPIKELLQATIN